MNHSLFVELRSYEISKQEVYALISKGKVVNVKNCGLSIIITVKGNGWRAWIRVGFSSNTYVEDVEFNELDNSEWLDIPKDASILEVQYACDVVFERCRFRYRYAYSQHEVTLIAVIDITNFDKTDSVVYKLIARHFHGAQFYYLIRPM